MKNDNFGDRRKEIEKLECDRKFLPLVPIIVRLDGKTFHNYCKDFIKPFDQRFNSAMVETVSKLIDITNAKIGYTQSDEITLLYYSDSYDCQLYFDGNIQKMVSVLSSLCTANFNDIVKKYIPEKELKGLAYFDCRAFPVGSKQEAFDQFVFRQIDCSSNSVSMAAHAYFNHKELHGKGWSEMQEMLFAKKGINWNDYCYRFKRGSFIKKKKEIKKFTSEELENLPVKHKALSNPNMEYERSYISYCDLYLLKLENGIEVLFDGKDPTYKKEGKVL